MLQKRFQFRAKKRKGPLPFRYVLLLSIAIFILLTAQGIWFIDRNIRPTLLEIANLETQKIATAAINYAVTHTADNVDMNDLINIEKDSEGKIISVGFDANVYNNVVTQSVSNAKYYLKLVEEGKLPELEKVISEGIASGSEQGSGIIFQIPLGQATGNALLTQIGPLVPVKFISIGEVTVDLNEEIIPVGINNTWIRVSLDLEVTAQVVIPFATHTEPIKTTVPVGMIFVPGEVPPFFGGGSGNMPQPAIITEMP